MANLIPTDDTYVRPLRWDYSNQTTKPAGVALTRRGMLVRPDGDGAWALASGASAATMRGAYLALEGANIANVKVSAIRKGVIDMGDALDDLDDGDPVYASLTAGTLADSNVGGTNETQTATITGTPTGGTFTLTFQGQTTTAIAYNAAASAVQTALEALSTIGTGNVAVSGSAGGPYTITFQGDLAGTDVAQLTASGAGLTGGTTPAVAIAAGVPGSDGFLVGHVEKRFHTVTGRNVLVFDLSSY